MKRIYLLRHGETHWNLSGKVQGTEDILLTDMGKKQAYRLSKSIKNEKIDHIYSSDLNRAITTASIIGNELNIKVNVHRDLREINFGVWQGLTLDEIKKKYKNEHTIWRTYPHNLILTGSETLLEVKERTLKHLNKLRKLHADENVLLVAHGTSIKVLILAILEIELSNYNKFSIENTGLTIIEFREHCPVLIKFNDTSHLRRFEFEE